MAQDQALLDDYVLEDGTNSDSSEEKFNAMLAYHTVRLQPPNDKHLTDLTNVSAFVFDNERVLDPALTLPDFTPNKPVQVKPLPKVTPEGSS